MEVSSWTQGIIRCKSAVTCNQCDQMTSLCFQYLANYGNENLSKNIQIVPKWVENFSPNQIKLKYFANFSYEKRNIRQILSEITKIKTAVATFWGETCATYSFKHLVTLEMFPFLLNTTIKTAPLIIVQTSLKLCNLYPIRCKLQTLQAISPPSTV